MAGFGLRRKRRVILIWNAFICVAFSHDSSTFAASVVIFQVFDRRQKITLQLWVACCTTDGLRCTRAMEAFKLIFLLGF